MRFLAPPPAHDLTYSDVFLVPGASELRSRFDVDLAPTDGTAASIPIVSANMNSVTGARLAATLARRGGLAVLPQDMPLQALDEAIHWVKARSPHYDTPVSLTADTPVSEALRRIPAVQGYAVVVRRRGAQEDDAEAVLGVVPAERLEGALAQAPLGDLLPGRLVAIEAEDVPDGRAAFDALLAAGAEVAVVRQHGRVLGTISRRSAVRATIYRPHLDAEGRLAVAAAIGINGEVAAKARALREAGIDLLVVDTAHGHQRAALDAVRTVKGLGLGIPVVAGNVVTAEAVRDLVQAGADIVKVGVGPGAMCTTRMMTAVGRPQFSAVLETAQAAAELGASVWADGGVRHPRDVALALAAGASNVMIGSWFAGTIEAPGRIERDEQGRAYKESWGMASTKAVLERFGRLDPFELARKTLFAEGISSSTIYLDPLRPSVEDLLDMITAGVRSSFTYAGARTVAEFAARAVVGVQSAAGYEEGKPLPSSW